MNNKQILVFDNYDCDDNLKLLTTFARNNKNCLTQRKFSYFGDSIITSNLQTKLTPWKQILRHALVLLKGYKLPADIADSVFTQTFGVIDGFRSGYKKVKENIKRPFKRTLIVALEAYPGARVD